MRARTIPAAAKRAPGPCEARATSFRAYQRVGTGVQQRNQPAVANGVVREVELVQAGRDDVGQGRRRRVRQPVATELQRAQRVAAAEKLGQRLHARVADGVGGDLQRKKVDGAALQRLGDFQQAGRLEAVVVELKVAHGAVGPERGGKALESGGRGRRRPLDLELDASGGWARKGRAGRGGEALGLGEGTRRDVTSQPETKRAGLRPFASAIFVCGLFRWKWGGRDASLASS